MKLRFHLAVRRHAADELKLNFQHAAVVGLGLPGLVDDRFSVGVGGDIRFSFLRFGIGPSRLISSLNDTSRAVWQACKHSQ